MLDAWSVTKTVLGTVAFLAASLTVRRHILQARLPWRRGDQDIGTHRLRVGHDKNPPKDVAWCHEADASILTLPVSFNDLLTR
jgi:hypothetical protein